MSSFHGAGKRRSYFEGWYLKQQNETETVALIPAYHVDGNGAPSASLQVVGGGSACWLPFPAEQFRADRGRFLVRLGDCVFSHRGCRLSVRSKDCALEGVLSFGPFTPPPGDVMGPLRFAPVLQCRHSVFSLYHRVNGALMLNGREIRFRNGSGYLEGDRGTSFPARYVWTQCSRGGDSVMLSAADVPFAGRSFVGCIGVLLVDGKVHRVATYLGAKVLEAGGGGILVRQGNLMLRVSLLESRPLSLRAPESGGMTRVVRESAVCRVRYQCTVGEKVWFDFTDDLASFESSRAGGAETAGAEKQAPPLDTRADL